jgi:hypothetical protein
MNRLCLTFLGLLVIPAALAVVAHSPGGQARQSSTTGTPSTAFVGAWRLVSTEEVLKDGTSRPYSEVGSHGLGYLMYTADGHMCAQLSNSERPKWDYPPTAAQKLAAFDTYTAYCGRFEVDEPNHVVWHYPEMAADPSFVGTKRRRPYRFEGNRLIFSGKQGPDEDDQTVDHWTIVWERAR